MLTSKKSHGLCYGFSGHNCTLTSQISKLGKLGKNLREHPHTKFFNLILVTIECSMKKIMRLQRYWLIPEERF